MKDKTVNVQLEEAQTALAEAEAVEKGLREEYQAMLNDKLAIEMNLGSITKSAERKMQLLRTEFVEAGKILTARRERVAQLKALAMDVEVRAARAEKRKFIEDVVRVSREAIPHLEALAAITGRIREIEALEYDHARRVNHELALEGKFSLSVILRFNTGNLLPPSFNLDAWLESADKTCRDFLTWA